MKLPYSEDRERFVRAQMRMDKLYMRYIEVNRLFLNTEDKDEAYEYSKLLRIAISQIRELREAMLAAD